MKEGRPVIAVPMGDPAGIGPEIIVKALTEQEVIHASRCVVIGDRRIFETAVRICEVDLSIHEISDPKDGDYREGNLNLINLGNVDQDTFQFGRISGMCGRAAYECIEKAISLANEGKVVAVATTPINKESLRAGGVPYIGHTEIFGALTGTDDPLTMFETNGLRVFFLTRHVSLRQMLEMIKKERIIDYVKRCVNVLDGLGIRDGSMAIAGLNPHCGEHGLFGWEEVQEIIPAIRELQAVGYHVEGPIGADSVFHQAAVGRYNSVLSLYHDQGHIAAKTLDFERTISITGGMPFLRTSVDHGTAFDIAGKGIASSVSMAEAIKAAVKYGGRYQKQKLDAREII